MKNKMARINVTVSTLWTDPSSVREMDAPAAGNPVDIQSWLRAMTEQERKALLDENRIQSQVLYGEPVQILDQQGDWTRVAVPSQQTIKDIKGYPGWIPTMQLTEGDEEWEGMPLVRVKEKRASLLTIEGTEILPLTYNTTLPLIKEYSTYYEILSPHGLARINKKDVDLYQRADLIPKKDGRAIVNEAKQFQGLTYLWGGMSAYGYDCSGYSYNILKANGYLIPRDAKDQAAAGVTVHPADVQPGDLLFFAYEEGKGAIHHVAIYYGEGKIIHSPTPGKKIMVQTLKGSFYAQEWCATRRYWTHEK
ncbi:C40 family peptidase [Jeotgalibacillus sp. ET6]|uniref:C40 family peptidase n=1 Tax=Jeotgalibacillus sp. ET6 TaxID=3037260 RepID=UPI0024186949|nr:C40 family peptidase [Jeotgalibacillus sp. ET6]MDG5472707.1 C40 family peptidase [Jeotgalibacillus sp. ET6]